MVRHRWQGPALLAPTVILLLLLMVQTAHQKCFHRLDLAVAVDVTSSVNAVEFEKVKSLVKEVVAFYDVSPTKTRLALISYSETAQILLNFDDVITISDFNDAVDRLEFLPTRAITINVMLLVKKHIKPTVRTVYTSFHLIMVKDGRYHDLDDRMLEETWSELDAVFQESMVMRRMGIVFHNVALGGTWQRENLAKVQGDLYILCTSLTKAQSNFRSLTTNKLCTTCHERVGSEYVGPCLDNMRYAWRSTVIVDDNLLTDEKCRIQIARRVEKCSTAAQSCSKVSREVLACEPVSRYSFAPVVSTWNYFDTRVQSCRTKKEVERMRCNTTHLCTKRITADVVILLDKTKDSRDSFSTIKEATKAILNGFHIGGPNADLKFAVLTFQSYGRDIQKIVTLDSVQTKAEILAAVDNIPETSGDFLESRGHLFGIRAAIEHLKTGYKNKNHKNNYIVMITTGRTNTVFFDITSVTDLLVAEQISTFAIGVGNDVDLKQMTDITAPESESNLLMIKDFSTLIDSAKQLASVMCLQMAPPIPKLCEAAVTLNQISTCPVGILKQPTHILEYRFDSAKKCQKTRKLLMGSSCNKVITDPFNGQQHNDADRITLCHKYSTNPTPVTQCVAADMSCKAVGSDTFSCRDERGEVSTSCTCISKGGETVLQIEPNY